MDSWNLQMLSWPYFVIILQVSRFGEMLLRTWMTSSAVYLQFQRHLYHSWKRNLFNAIRESLGLELDFLTYTRHVTCAQTYLLIIHLAKQSWPFRWHPIDHGVIDREYNCCFYCYVTALGWLTRSRKFNQIDSFFFLLVCTPQVCTLLHVIPW